MNYSKLLPLFLCFSLAACGDEGLETNQTTQSQIKIVNSIELDVLINSVRLRAESNSKSKIITKLSTKDNVIWMGEVSDSHDSITLRDVKFKTPWLKVKTKDQQEGWIYAAATKASSSVNNLSEQFAILRSQSFFGDDLASQIMKYRKNYHAANTDKLFADAYQRGQKIRDNMVEILEKKASIDLPNEMDMTWLEAAMPGYTLAYVAEGTQYYLFANFKKMLITAQASKGEADDDFLQLSSQIYAYASETDTESFFYTWFEQTWDYGGESLLGQGKHLASLKKLTEFSKSSNLFGAQIAQYKDALVKDIDNRETGGETDIVKESKVKKAEELTAILALNSSLLSKGDIAIIEKRQAELTQ